VILKNTSSIDNPSWGVKCGSSRCSNLLGDLISHTDRLRKYCSDKCYAYEKLKRARAKLKLWSYWYGRKTREWDVTSENFAKYMAADLTDKQLKRIPFTPSEQYQLWLEWRDKQIEDSKTKLEQVEITKPLTCVTKYKEDSVNVTVPLVTPKFKRPAVKILKPSSTDFALRSRFKK
jgi:hypothetical protein